MARHTSLYQQPRSPLIQGRTRWDRPLWQAWLGGTLVTTVLLTTLLFVRTTGQGARFTFDGAWVWLILGVVVGAGIGTVLGRLWGWRVLWLSASFWGAVLGVGVYVGYVWWIAARVPQGFGG